MVSRFTNRLEDGTRPGHKLLSAGLAPQGGELAALQDRKRLLLSSLAPPDTDADRTALFKVVAALLGAFPTYGADREDAKATVGLACRALDDVPVWAVQRAAGNFLKGSTKIPWSPDRAPTPPQIRSEAKLVTLDTEIELFRISQIIDAEIVDAETTEGERKAALASWEQLKAEMGRSNIGYPTLKVDLGSERTRLQIGLQG